MLSKDHLDLALVGIITGPCKAQGILERVRDEQRYGGSERVITRLDSNDSLGLTDLDRVNLAAEKKVRYGVSALVDCQSARDVITHHAMLAFSRVLRSQRTRPHQRLRRPVWLR